MPELGRWWTTSQAAPKGFNLLIMVMIKMWSDCASLRSHTGTVVPSTVMFTGVRGLGYWELLSLGGIDAVLGSEAILVSSECDVKKQLSVWWVPLHTWVS